MKRKILFFMFFSMVILSFSCKKEDSDLDKVTGLWYVRIIAEQQVNEKGVLAYKSYTEYKRGDKTTYATVNFQGSKAYFEESSLYSNGIVRREYTYHIDANNLVLVPVLSSAENEVYKMTYLGLKNSLVLDKGEVDQNNVPFNLKKVLVREIPIADPADEEIGSEPNQGPPSEA